ncbi:SRPBCC family protein [Flagellimonas sp.]|uniref:SRPBCC family protein n=1 Tax=Flagellimonas sp. TaxID=2058762 RepID=UPI003F49C178
MHLESPKRTVAKSQKEIFEFLSDIKNFEKLMPENIDKFEVLDEITFRFALRGMPEIVLRKQGETPNSEVILGAASSKLNFTLTALIDEVTDAESEVILSFEGKFNAMMAMMIKGPITNFIEALSSNMTTAI